MLYIYIPLCLCEPLSFGGGWGGRKRWKGPFFRYHSSKGINADLFVKTPFAFCATALY